MERAYIRPEVVRGLYQDYRCPILYTSTQEIRSDFFGRGEGGKEGGADCYCTARNIEMKSNFICSELQVKTRTNTSTLYQSLITTINRDCSTVNVGTFQPSLSNFQTNNPASFARARRITPFLIKALRGENMENECCSNVPPSLK